MKKKAKGSRDTDTKKRGKKSAESSEKAQHVRIVQREPRSAHAGGWMSAPRKIPNDD